MPKPTLQKIDPELLPDDLRAAHARSIKLRGDATFFEVFGNHPDLYRWYTNSFYGDVFHGGKVDRRTKELVRLRLSTTHGCRFCNQGNRVDAREAGLTESDIDSIADYENSDLEERDKLALRLADQMVLTNPNGELTEALYSSLRHYFDDAQILELGLILGVLSGIAKFIFAFDLVEKEDNCPIR